MAVFGCILSKTCLSPFYMRNRHKQAYFLLYLVRVLKRSCTIIEFALPNPLLLNCLPLREIPVPAS